MKAKQIITTALLIIICFTGKVAGSNTSRLVFGTYNKVNLTLEFKPASLSVNKNAFILTTKTKKFVLKQNLKNKLVFTKRISSKINPFVKNMFNHFSVKPVFDFLENGKLVSLAGFKLKIKI